MIATQYLRFVVSYASANHRRRAGVGSDHLERELGAPYRYPRDRARRPVGLSSAMPNLVD
jgi:hypothetical protein